MEAIRTAAGEDGSRRMPSPEALSVASVEVRVQDDEAADRSARLLSADAVAFGKQVLFRTGRYAPQTDWGRALLAHELTHVAQQTESDRSLPHRSVATDLLSVQWTEEMAHSMGTSELDDQMVMLRSYLVTNPDDLGASENLLTLERVASARQATTTTPQQRSQPAEPPTGGAELSVTGRPGGRHLTIGQLTEETGGQTYVETGYYKSGELSPLAKEVKTALNHLRQEFDEFAHKTPPFGAAPSEPVGSLARQEVQDAFADSLSPALSRAVTDSETKVDQHRAAQNAAQTEIDTARSDLKALADEHAVGKTQKAALAARRHDATKRETEGQMQLRRARSRLTQATRALEDAIKKRDQLRSTIALALDTSKTTEHIAAVTAGKLCNVIAYYLYGRSIGITAESTSFGSFYLKEIEAGHIARHGAGSQEGIFWGAGADYWNLERGLAHTSDRADESVPLGNVSRKAELDAFLASSANIAISHQDFMNEPPKAPHHFLLIVKGDDGVWHNLDHTSHAPARRGGVTDWNRVFDIRVDAALIQEAKGKLSAPSAATEIGPGASGNPATAVPTP
jgi:hypothetical protein